MADDAHMDLLVAHLVKMLRAPAVPDIPPELAGVPDIVMVHENMARLREILDAFSRGDFSPEIGIRGVLAGRLKTLQASLLHLCWQIQQVAGGDFTQRVEFLGEFAQSFNTMVVQLDTALTALRQKEEELTLLTRALQGEVEQKAEAMAALSKSEARFRYMAEHDLLTNVCNRRSFYDLAVMELERARRKRYSCALIILDVDHFKRFNDTYGHLDGDTALCHLTQTVKGELRGQDILGRYGGEEFVLLLPDVDLPASEAIAERLRLAVAGSPVATKTAGLAEITISMGLALVPPQGSEERRVAFLERYLGFADAALYEAKAAGRNCYRVSSCRS